MNTESIRTLTGYQTLLAHLVRKGKLDLGLICLISYYPCNEIHSISQIVFGATVFEFIL